MADWTTLPNLAVGVGGLPSGTTVTALRDNPIAIAEGAPGAPKVQGVALDKTCLGVISRNNSNSPIGFSGLDDCRGVFLTGYLGARSGVFDARTVQIRYSSDNGATWGAYQDLLTAATNSGNIYGPAMIHVDLVSGQIAMAIGEIPNVIQTSTTVPPNVNAFQIRWVSSISGNRFSFIGFLIGGSV